MSIRYLSNKLLPLFLLVAFASSCRQKKTVYVDMFKLVNEFELQKEYSDEARRESEKEKAAVDSAVYAEKLKDPAASESLKQNLYTALYRKTEDRNKEIESLIWKRLNPYISDYGKEHGYQYILGANGTGNVLYADEKENVTDDLIKYVNDRYHDKK